MTLTPKFQELLTNGTMHGWGLPERLVVENELRQSGNRDALGAFQKLVAFVPAEALLSPENVASFGRALSDPSLHFGTPSTLPELTVTHRSTRAVSPAEARAAVGMCLPGASMIRYHQSHSGAKIFAMVEHGGRRLLKIALTESQTPARLPVTPARTVTSTVTNTVTSTAGSFPDDRSDGAGTAVELSSSEFTSPEVAAAYARACAAGHVRKTEREATSAPAVASEFTSPEAFRNYQKAVAGGFVR